MMKYIVLVLFAGLLSMPGRVKAEDVSYRAKGGDQALLFRLCGLDSLGIDNFKGGIGWQYYLPGTNHLALRLGIGINHSSQGFDNHDMYDKYSVKSFGFSFTPGIRYNFASSSNILAYFGSEIEIAIKNSVIKINDYNSDSKTIEDYYACGAGFFVGAEWFAFKNVSLSAEYNLRCLYEKSYQKVSSYDNTIQRNIPEKFSVGTGTAALNFTLSFYFN